MNKNKICILGIGGIGISALARYYLNIGYEVFGTDISESELIKSLRKEGIKIEITNNFENIDFHDFEKIIYTEAINIEQIPRLKKILNIKSYPEALGEIVNNKKLIAITGTHGKSTTTSLVSLVLKNTNFGVNAIIGTILKEFGNKNAYFSKSDYFVIEACEYKRSFLNYKPFIGVITNIDLDHLDYYKDLNDYINAFDSFINNIIPGGIVLINGNCKNSKKLLGKRNDISYIEIFDKYAIFTPDKMNKNIILEEIITFPEIKLKVPGKHILFDAHIAYTVGYLLGINSDLIIKTLENYNGVWRRMEIIGKTQNQNTLMSDYGHHPTEIKATLKALKEQNPARPILTIFQPHQYSRTLELLEEFKKSFYDTDKLIIPNIYESRDKIEDKKKINSKILIEKIEHFNKIDGNGFENTLIEIEKWDKENKFGLILLLGAGDIDNLRYKIKINKA